MERNNITYVCLECKKEVNQSEELEPPVCHGQKMIVSSLDFCTNAPHPEMMRNSMDNEPCDDNRG